MSDQAAGYREGLEAISQGLAEIDLLPGTPYREAAMVALRGGQRLLECKLTLELCGTPPPRIVAFVGGTNVGKSTMFNLFLGADVAGPAETAGATKCAVVTFGPADRAAVESPAFLPGYRKAPLTDVSHANEHHAEPTAFVREAGKALPWILVDSPDVDSRVIENAGVGQDALWIADSVFFVTTDQKYLDRLPLEFFQAAHKLGKELIVVFNKMEDEAKGKTIADDFCVKTGVSADAITRIVMPFHKGLMAGNSAGAALEPARALLSQDASALKRRTVAGSARFLVDQLEPAFVAYEREQGHLAKALERMQAIAAERRREYEVYARALSTEKFYELDAAVRRILDEHGIPYLTELMTSITKGLGEVFSVFRGKILGQEEAKPPIEARRQAAFDECLRQAEAAGRNFRQHLRSQKEDAELANVLYERVSTLEELDRARLQATYTNAGGDREAFTGQIEEKIRDWLKGNPRQRIWLQVFRIGLQGGITGLVVALTGGGLALNDLLYGPATAMATEAVFHHLAPPGFFKEFQRRFVELEMAAFDAVLTESYTEPTGQQLPASDGGARINTLRGDIAGLAGALSKES